MPVTKALCVEASESKMLFGKKKQAPTVKLDGMVFKFDSSAQSWETEYEGIFVSVEGAGL